MTNEEYREVTKTQILPLARIKKIMKIDDEMISSEGPILIAKASEFLIEELTLRAWLHADSCRRKTLQKIDIGDATTQSEIFDFLIDIVPRPGQRQSDVPIPILPRPSAGLVPVGIAGQDAASANSNEEPKQFVPAAIAVDPQQFQTERMEKGEEQPQYLFQCDSFAPNGPMLVQLQDGRMVEATIVGPSFHVEPGQPINMIMSDERPA
ncbi:CBFD-NFYB-HMF domain-containing protein [Aphelenchoides fujianensis]|nr:CBFD-NFYB-HMF domain-containing protein [Aphelenchoides fujianensis]